MRGSYPPRRMGKAPCRIRKPDMTFCAPERNVRTATLPAAAHSGATADQLLNPTLRSPRRATGTPKVEGPEMYYNWINISYLFLPSWKPKALDLQF